MVYKQAIEANSNTNEWHTHTEKGGGFHPFEHSILAVHYEFGFTKELYLDRSCSGYSSPNLNFFISRREWI